MNQRTSGHNWERILASILSDRLKSQFVTARSESKRTDDRGVDFVSDDITFPVEFQAKEQTFNADSKSYSIKVEALDNMISDKQRALLVRMWKKKKGKSRRTQHGNYMVVSLDFGLELLDAYVNRRIETGSVDE